MSRREDERVADILSAIGRVQSYRESLSAADAVTSGMAYDAVLRNLAVIGEAVRSLPEEFRAARPDAQWASIAGLRNVVIHEYFRVDREVILDIINNDLARLAESLRAPTD